MEQDTFVKDSKYYKDNHESITDIEVMKFVDIAPLESNKVYSPMFDKTFDKMTPDEQKAQLDAWVEDGSINDRTQYPFKKKLTKDQRESNFKKFVRGKRR